jgi:hypothetical protein
MDGAESVGANTLNTNAKGAQQQAILENQIRAAIYISQQRSTEKALNELENKTKALRARADVNNILRPFLSHEHGV